MKIIPIEKKGKALESFRRSPAASFTETAKRTGVHRVTLYHWYRKSGQGGLSWCHRGRQTSVHYPGHTKKAVLQAYDEGDHHFGALAETFGYGRHRPC